MAFSYGDLDPNYVKPTEGQDNSEEDLDFSYLFHYNRPEFSTGGDNGNSPHPALLPQLCEDSYPDDPSQQSYLLPGSGAGLDPLELLANGPGLAPTPSPRIEITPSWEPLQPLSLDCSPGSTALMAYREQQCLSPASSNSSTGWLAESNSPWTSPCVSPSGGGGGVGQLAQDLCPGLQGISTSSGHSSPGTSPRNSITEETFQLLQSQRTSSASPNPHSLSHLRSRSASPQGKRTYDQYSGSPCLGTPVYPRSRSPSPGPLIPQGSHHQLQPQAPLQLQAQASPNLEELLSSPYRAVSSKMVRNSKESYVWGETQTQGILFGENQTQDTPYGDTENQSSLYADTKVWVCEQERRGRPESGPGTGLGARLDTLYVLPPIWSSPLTHNGALSVPALSSVPPLDWPVPSQSGQYQLQILQQPRPHHRAHYETEGSRGPVKAPGGGHPEVQLCGYRGSGPLGLLVFIGTADEKVMRPHSFYQVHRITGKTVTTPSLERTVQGTKALELPLEPSNNMRVVIDCAGILKLRNADIELRNGETNIGRKNTRVRLVYRVHIPEPTGQVVSLQVASQPIECSQRSAQEYPRVENQDLECCSVLGGQQMILLGQNFTSESRVVFTEKTHVQIWEAEANVDRDKSRPNILFVEVPPYRDLSLHQAVQVNFFVMNGRRKCSLSQPFTYAPLTAVKREPVDDYQYSLLGCAVSQASRQTVTPGYHTQSTHLIPSHHSMPGTAPYQQLGVVPDHSDSFYQAQYKPPPAYHPTSINRAHQPPGSGATFTGGGPAQTLTRPQQGQPCQAPQPGPQSQVLHASQHVGIGALPDQTRPGDREYLAPVSPCPVGASPGASGGQMYRGYVQVQTVLPLGRSPPCYTQGLVHRDPEPRARSGQDQGCQSLAQRGPATSCLSGLIPGKITVKQENLNQNYLDDVNDIISSNL
ncbi:nuclear factor of activated T-cells, cytoplasmic 2 isoform X2 [Hypomesus transpacificus]|uniref:nuclear factor of activated T-cells, cytoplasmic 2 isoform X2 n=1 Tax=Hypomesus transpacificus TaxID=137520 RepID=UPI001F077C74|nr:nuclear factor of activated T-cells, cytoplasmic 2 isoform X2 [Hypomesus transpacificus]